MSGNVHAKESLSPMRGKTPGARSEFSVTRAVRTPDLQDGYSEAPQNREVSSLTGSRFQQGVRLPLKLGEVLRTGQPLGTETRAFFEQRFGHDFSKVLIHTDACAGESAQAASASAYAVGNHLVFGPGRYPPRTAEAQWLLAHELAHVAQRGNSPVANALNRGISESSEPAEREAHTAASQALAGTRVNLVQRPTAMIHRSYAGAAVGAGAGALVGAGAGALLGGMVAGPLGALVGAGLGALAGGIAGAFLGSYLTIPLTDMSTFQSPGNSGWWGAKFGCYRDNCTRPHRGWDIHAPVGTKIRAVTFGSMTHHDNPGGWGHYVRLQSRIDPTRTYLYGHLSNRQPPGNYLPSQELGETGVSGNAQANRPHLHFEVLSNGVSVDPANHFAEPRKVVEALGSPTVDIDKSAAAPCKPCAM